MKLKNIIIASSALLAFSSCSDLFEPAIENKQDLSQMFQDKEFARGILGSAYLQLPYQGGSVTDVATDDAVTNDNSSSYITMAQGGWAANQDPMSQWQGRYNAIQYCNLMLENVDQVEWAADPKLNELYARHFKGNAYAMRALQFFYLLRAHAGVDASGNLLGAPIHNEFEDGGADFNQHRASFQACIEQIFKDLAEAEKLLPYTYGNVAQNDPILATLGCNNGQYNRAFGDHERGKIDGKIIAALRAQVALFAASPAYESAKAATWKDAAEYAATLLDEMGGIAKMEKKGWTWYGNVDELKALGTGDNTNEIIWRDNLVDNHDLESNNYPPVVEGQGRINPSQNLVDAFPMANGYPITDPASGYNPAKPYEGRDPRLAAYILCNGATIGVDENYVLHTGIGDNQTIDGINVETKHSTRTGYYMHKHLRDDVNLASGKETNLRHYSARIRATEIFLDYAEAANEDGGPNASYNKGEVKFSAKDVIRALRQRAGVGGDNDPYLEQCATSKEKMRELIRNERRLELCFENQRFYDLRRWKVDLSKLNETVKGIQITSENPDGSIAYSIIDVETRGYKDYMYYGPVPYGETMKWSNLEQNQGW